MSMIGLGGMPLTGLTGPIVIANPPADTPPQPGEITGPQGALYPLTQPYNGWGGAAGSYNGIGTEQYAPFGWPTQGSIGGAIGPLGFGGGFGAQGAWGSGMLPGYGPAWPGTYANYRLMLMHPTLQLARSIVLGAMLTGKWNWIIKKGAPKEITDWVMATFPRLRRAFIANNFRALDYGWYPREKIYAIKDGLVTLVRQKPLEVIFTQILIDKHGNFAGLRPTQLYGMATRDKSDKNPPGYWPYDLTPNKSAIYTYDGEAGRLYGRSRLENCRRAVGDYWQDNDHITRLSRKASGIVLMIKVPPGGFTDQNTGKKIRWIDHAQCLGAAIMGGTGSGFIVAENVVGFDIKDDGTAQAKAEAIKAMAGTNLWGFETINLGDSGPAMVALKDILGYKDNIIFRGYLLPERAGLEAAHGTKEEAGTHTDTASARINADHEDITDNFANDIRECVAWNFGQEHADDCIPEAVPQNDLQEAVDKSIILGVIQNADLAAAQTAGLDFSAIFERRGVPARTTPIKAVTSDVDSPGATGNVDQDD